MTLNGRCWSDNNSQYKTEGDYFGDSRPMNHIAVYDIDSNSWLILSLDTWVC